MPTKHITDRWTVCEKDHVHWGQNGAAGFLFRYVPREGEPRYLLQQRAKSVDFPGTWGIPGGAMREGESPEAGARREVLEEVGLIPAYRITGIEVQDCGGGVEVLCREGRCRNAIRSFRGARNRRHWLVYEDRSAESVPAPGITRVAGEVWEIWSLALILLLHSRSCGSRCTTG